MLEILRDDAEATRRAAEALVAVSREYGLALWLALGALPSAWARAKLADRDAGSAEFRQAVADYASGGNRLFLPFYRGLLAEIEAERGSAEAAVTGIDEALALAGETGEHWFDAGLHRIRGEILLKQYPADPAAAEAAFLAAIAIAQQQKARSFELRAALSLARLYQSTGRPIDAHDVLAPVLAGFSPTPEFPAIAEAKALFEALAADDTVKAEATRRAQRLKLQASYGQAVMWGKGFAAEETKAAVARVGELAKGTGDGEAPFETYHARWAHHLFRAEFGSARETAESLLREAERAERAMESGVGHRLLGAAVFYAGDFALARAHCEQALRIYEPDRDREAKFRFGIDTADAATAYLALAAWCLGDVGRARELMNDALARAVESNHAPTLANMHISAAWLEVLRDDAEAALRAAESCVVLSREHGLATYLAGASWMSAWARAKLGDRNAGSELRQALADLDSQGVKFLLPFYRGLLAEIEAERGDAEAALARIDGALALASQTGEHWFDAGLHRIRGEILLKLNPADPAAAEAAFLAAIAVAQQQKARSFELRAALSLAKLCQSTGRAVDAHAVLAPALEGFAPTPEFPEIEQAQELLAALATSDDVKNAAESRRRRLKLQTSYGQALSWSRGFGAEETKAAFTRAEQLAAGADAAAERFDAYWGLWVARLTRGELGLARETAEVFRRETVSGPWMTEAGVARRILGLTCLWQGDLMEARSHLEEAARTYDPERDRDAKFRFGLDSGATASLYLALTNWLLGEIGPARKLLEEAVERAVESAHPATLANTQHYKAMFEILSGDAAAARLGAETVVEVSQENGLALYLARGGLSSGWVRARLDGRESDGIQLREALAAYSDLGNKVEAPFFQGLLAEIEAEGPLAEAAPTTIDKALALAGETGEHWFDAALHRIRGEILLKQNPADPAAAEAAFLAAIAVAQQQQARSFELRAALSLARLYQSTGRPIDAHDILGPALQGFSPTPEFPEIAEAKALFEALAGVERVKAWAARRER